MVIRLGSAEPVTYDLTCITLPGTELVVLGTGAKIVPVHRDVKDYLKSKGIALEVQDTVSHVKT